MAAPGAPGAATGWGPGRKQAFGAAPGPRSRVWFTVAQGNLSEVFYPTVDRPILLGLRFLVAAPGAPPIDDATEAEHEVRWVEPGVPAFRISCSHAEYALTNEVVVDPESDALLLAVGFQPEMPDLQLYLQAEPHGPADGYVLEGDPPSLFACVGGDWLAIVGPFARCTAGYRHASDLLVDLHDSDGTMTTAHDRAVGGYVGLGAQIGLRSGAFQLAIGFGDEPEVAEETARQALERGARRVREDLAGAWRMLPDLDRNILRVAGDGGALARSSLTVLRCLEEKGRRGAFVAAPAAPWGIPEQRYARVWVRDLFHVASALLDAGDVDAARRALGYLDSTQRDDGSWAQNQSPAGEAAWGGEELDQVALPILLAWRLGVAGALDRDPWPRLVRRAAAHLVTHGPATGLDRWEDAGGYSPSTLAVSIAALVAAAEFAEEAGETQAAGHLRSVADHWNDSIEAWTYLRAFRHYVRLAADPDLGAQPDDPVGLEFLELVRRGVRAADDLRIRNSLTTADVILETPLAAGQGWRRYAGDAYGELDDGSDWAPGAAGRGRPWPLLTGERAFYDLSAGRPPVDHIRALETWAGPELILPEQVWDGPDLPDRGLLAGRSTGSAAPLGWAHAEYLSLLAAIASERLPDVVAPAWRRYVERSPDAPPPVWSHAHRFRRFPCGRAVRVQLPRAGTVHWTTDGWASERTAAARDVRLGCWVAELPLQQLPEGASAEWVPRYLDGRDDAEVRTFTAAGRPAD